MSWKKLLESVSESLNDYIQLRNDYLMAENRILRNQIASRVQLTDSDRRVLAAIGAKLGKKALEEIATIATPNTLLAWNRKFAAPHVGECEPLKSVGRPRIDKEIEDLVLHMARENRSWGNDRIQGALSHLGYAISDQTVGNILKRHQISPAPERKKTVTWREYTQSHLGVLMATGFFNSDVWSWLGLMVSDLLTLVLFGRHPIQVARGTLHQPLLALQALMFPSPDESPDGQRRTRWITEQLPVKRLDGRIRIGGRIRRSRVFERVFCTANKPHQVEVGKAVMLFDSSPKLIRDDPSRRRHRLGDVLRDQDQKAA